MNSCCRRNKREFTTYVVNSTTPPKVQGYNFRCRDAGQKCCCMLYVVVVAVVVAVAVAVAVFVVVVVVVAVVVAAVAVVVAAVVAAVIACCS